MGKYDGMVHERRTVNEISHYGGDSVESAIAGLMKATEGLIDASVEIETEHSYEGSINAWVNVYGYRPKTEAELEVERQRVEADPYTNEELMRALYGDDYI